MKSKIPKGSAQGGFTLIEVLVVLAIVAILGTVGFTSMGSRSPRAVKSGLVALRAALFDARQAALATGQPVRLTMTWDGNQASQITGNQIQFTMPPSMLRYARYATTLAGANPLPDTSVQGLQAAISFGFAAGASGWNTNLVGTNGFGFSPTGQPVAVTPAGVMTPLPGGFWVGLVGRTRNTTGVPYGVVLVADKGQLITLYKGDSLANDTAEQKWQRLE